MAKKKLTPKFNVGDKVIAISEDPIRVKHFDIGGIFINEDGITYNDGMNYSSVHSYEEKNVYKTEKDAMVRVEELINAKTEEYKQSLIEGISNGS